MNFNWLFAQETTIIYVGDPMCSWCYGFAPEITKAKAHYPEAQFKIVMGGLRPQGTETMKELGDFLKEHWEQVHEASGQPFSYDILKDKGFVYDTEPACRATVVAREMNHEVELDFFKAVQHLFYVENKNPAEVENYASIVKKFGLDLDKFTSLFSSEEMKNKTKEDFALASQMGVRGFPAVVVSHNGELHLVCKGYMKAELLIANIDKVIKK